MASATPRRPNTGSGIRVFFPIEVNTFAPLNPYVLELIEGLTDHPEVERVGFGLGLLERGRTEWDVLHIQWPETLTNWHAPSEDALGRIAATLRNWRRSGRGIVTTVHNYEPKPDFGPMGPRVYETVYAHTSHFVHLGRSSLDPFRQRFGERPWFPLGRHHVVDHPEYSFYDRFEPDAGVAKAISLLPRPLILVFGAIRSTVEEAFARDAFLQAGLTSGTLVFAGKVETAIMTPQFKATLRDDPVSSIVRFHRRIKDAEVRALFREVDFLLLPRGDRLNSGVQALANTYTLPAIVADSGVIGDVGRAASSFLFREGDVESAADAIRRAASLDAAQRHSLRSSVRDYRNRTMRLAACVERHLSIYRMASAQRESLPLPLNGHARGWAAPAASPASDPPG